MTTYQDPPLHSRRAARQGERADADNAMTSTERAIAAGTAVPLNGHAADAEPLNYATTSRPPLPQYDGQNLRPRRTVETADHADVPHAEMLPNQDPPNYRPRDYSPEGRRSQPSWGPQYGGVGDDGTVEFHTQGRENVPMTIPENTQFAQAVEPADPESAATESAAWQQTEQEPDVQQPASAEQSAGEVVGAVVAPALAEYHPEHTMTRRELRALREAGLITDVTDLSQPIPVQLPVQAAPEAAVDSSEAAEQPAPEAHAADVVAADAPVVDASLFEPPAADTFGHDISGADVLPLAEVPAAVAPIADPIPLVAPAPQGSTRLDSALAEFDALAAGREPLLPEPDAPAPVTGRRSAGPLLADDVAAVAETSAETPSEAPSAAELFPQPETLPPSTEGLSAFDALFQPPSAAIPIVVALPVDASVEHQDVVEAEIEPEPAPEHAAVTEQQPQMVDPLLAAPAPQGAPALVPPPTAYPTPVDLPAPPATQSPVVASNNPFLVASAPVAPHAAPSGESATPAEAVVGHWSTQAEIDDAEQLNETTISRSVGAGNTAITTSALVLPSVPDDAFGGPLGDNGEILLTGSISLPESLSSLGAHPSQLDQSDLDHLLDPGDLQVANTDSTPVRAIRAVSTHTASGGIISPTKPKGTRGFTILIIAASVMAVVVVGLLVAGLVSGTL